MTVSSCLRPDPDALAREWAELISAERAQVERLREWQETDHYAPLAQHFVDDPHRRDDSLLDALLSHSRTDATWLDVGAGGGRYSLPLALHSGHVTAIEPSPAMRAALSGAAKDARIENVTVVAERWPEEAGAHRADFSLMAHVGYDLPDIGGFLDALERATDERCFAILMERAPSSTFERLWLRVHGEPRVILPGLREFLHLLLARGAYPDVRLFARQIRPMDAADLREAARRRLWLAEGSAKEQALQELLDEELRAGTTEFEMPRRVALISWVPERG